jgi:hypothetical protein
MSIKLDILDGPQLFSLFEPAQINLTRYVRSHQGQEEVSESPDGSKDPSVLGTSEEI